MAITTIGDLLDKAGRFEARLETYYATLRDKTTDEGVRLLTYYLARHCRHLPKAVEEFSAQKMKQIREIKLKYDVEFDPEADFEILGTAPADIKGPHLLEAAVEYDSTLITLYGRVLEQPIGDEATAFFESLLGLEKKDIVMLKKMIAMNYF